MQFNRRYHTLLWTVMKFTASQLLLMALLVSIAHALPVSAQEMLKRPVTLMVDRQPLGAVLAQLEKAADVRFVYSPQVVRAGQRVSLNAQSQPLAVVLETIFRQTRIAWDIVGGQIILKRNPEGRAAKNAERPETERLADITARTVTGTVLDTATKSPLPGVSIILKGTTRGTTTDPAGKFSLSVPDEAATLTFSYIGFLSQEVSLSANQNTMLVNLQPDVKGLSEVVVVGYSTQRKADITGAVAKIDGDKLTGRPITQASQAFYGLVPGVSVNANTGEAGNNQTTIRIRGIGTLNNANPLILVDGIEAPIDNINPADIETITVLKDASSAAIYGSRAANGVVLVTTKRGQFDARPTISYSAFAGFSSPTVLPKMVTDNRVYLELYREAARNAGRTFNFTDADIQRYATLPSTDWISTVFRQQTPIQQHALLLTGGNSRTAYSVSLGYLNQEGIIRGNQNFQRYNGRINLDSRVNDKLQVGTSLAYSFDASNLTPKGEPEYTTNSTDVNSLAGKGSLAFESALVQHPLVPVYDQFGRYATLEQRLGIERNRNNVQGILDNENLSQKSNRFLGSVYAEYELLKNWKVRGTVAVNYQQEGFVDTRKQYTNYDFVTGNLVSIIVPGSQVIDIQSVSRNTTTWLQSTYEKTLGQHRIKLLAGFNQESSNQKANTARQTNFGTTSLVTLGSGATTNLAFTTQGEWALRSFFGRANYEFRGRYLAEATIRRDGSSRFGANNRWATFPSFSAGWIVSREPFWQVRAVDFLKIRASWGLLGNQNTALYPFASQVALDKSYTLNNVVTSGGGFNVIGNPDLKWEETTTADLGINVGLFGSRLTLEADYFNRNTTGILTQIANPLVLGIPSPTVVNAATVQNRGWEASAAYTGQVKALKISLGGNITYVKNEVTTINPTLTDSDDRVQLGSGGQNVWLIRGQPINTIYGYQVQGIFQSAGEIATAPKHTLFGTPQPGDFRFQDTDGNGTITDKDRTILGNRQPNWLYGFNLSLAAKGFDLAGLFQGIGRADIYLARHVGPFPFAGIREEWLNRWTPENPSQTYPRLWVDRTGYNGQTIEQLPASFWVKNRAYLRLKNVQLGYTLPKTVLGKTFVETCRVYVNAQNLLTITGLRDFDPERIDTEPHATSALPQFKTVTAGINLTF